MSIHRSFAHTRQQSGGFGQRRRSHRAVTAVLLVTVVAITGCRSRDEAPAAQPEIVVAIPAAGIDANNTPADAITQVADLAKRMEIAAYQVDELNIGVEIDVPETATSLPIVLRGVATIWGQIEAPESQQELWLDDSKDLPAGTETELILPRVEIASGGFESNEQTRQAVTVQTRPPSAPCIGGPPDGGGPQTGEMSMAGFDQAMKAVAGDASSDPELRRSTVHLILSSPDQRQALETELDATGFLFFANDPCANPDQ